MKSMTGFGYREFGNDQIHFILELKGYNSRFLDLKIILPPPLSRLEGVLRSFFTERIQRGRVEFTLKMNELEKPVEIHVDKQMAKAYTDTLNRLKTELNLKEEVSLSHLLAVNGVLKIESTRDVDQYRELIMPQMEELFNEYNKCRVNEGLSTKNDLVAITDDLEKRVEEITAYAPQIEASLKQRLIDKYKEIAGDVLSEEKWLAEIAVFLVKCDINEEVVRMRTHIEAFRSTMNSDEPVGKRLDFLCQEFNREINTIGSKSGAVEISSAVVEAKNLIEQAKEQARNVE